MKLIIIFLALIPTLVEAWLDRKGEPRKSKVTDTLWLVIAAMALALGVLWLLDISPLKTLALVLGFRILAFDYLVHAVLKRYSESHKDINIWKYTGKTTHWWDQWIAKIHWRWRLGIRVAVFVCAVVWFITPT